MKPHPRIRKTIKWGGLTVCILLGGLWAASQRWWVTWETPSWRLSLYRDNVDVWHYRQVGVIGPRGWDGGVSPPWDKRLWWVRWHWSAQSTRLFLPLWMPLTLAAACTATAWRLDTLARRRASTNACAKCGYDRAGLAADSKCPECGSAPSIA